MKTLEPQKKRVFKAGPFLEVLLLFCFVDGLNFILFRTHPGFAGLALQPYWLIVLPMAARYGFGAGFFSGLLAALHLVFLSTGRVPLRADLEKMAETGQLMLPIVFITAGIFIGDIAGRHLRRIERDEQALEEQEAALKKLESLMASEEKIRQALETRIVGESVTVKTLYEAAEKLEALDETRIYKACLEILAGHFKVQQASFFMKEDADFVLKASYGWDAGREAEGRVAGDQTIMNLAIRENRVLSVRDILASPGAGQFSDQFGTVLAMIPVPSGTGDPCGVVNVEKMDFFSLNKPNLELISLVVSWAARTLSQARLLREAAAVKIVDDADGLYTYMHFQHELAREWERFRVVGTSSSLAILKLERYGFLPEKTKGLLSRVLIAFIKRELRTADSLFHYRYEGTFAVMAPGLEPLEVSEKLEKGWAAFCGAAELELKGISLQIAFGSAAPGPDNTSAESWLTAVLAKAGMTQHP